MRKTALKNCIMAALLFWSLPSVAAGPGVLLTNQYSKAQIGECLVPVEFI